VRKVLLALLFSLLFGVAVGTVLRLRMERPVWYLGEDTLGEDTLGAGALRRRPAAALVARRRCYGSTQQSFALPRTILALSAHPLDIADARARVLDTRHHEQQIG
jgi:hypothetical protein